MPLLSFADLPSLRTLATPGAPAHPASLPALAREPNAELHALLDASLALPPETGLALASHLPMALQALAELGADAPRLRAFYAAYSRRFEATPAAAPAAAPPPADWPLTLGDFSAFAGLRTLFTQALAAQGRDAVLRATLPRLWPGLAAAAFHGPIRVAHAVQAGHQGELAAALAYWAARWQPLAPPPPAAAAQAWPLSIWSRGLAQAAAGWRSQAPLISLRMGQATATPAYQAWAGSLAPAASLQVRWLQLSTLALNTYADSGNFTALHMVTGLRAVQVLAPWLAGAGIDERVLDHAFTAAWLAARLPAPAGAGVAGPGGGRHCLAGRPCDQAGACLPGTGAAAGRRAPVPRGGHAGDPTRYRLSAWAGPWQCRPVARRAGLVGPGGGWSQRGGARPGRSLS